MRTIRVIGIGTGNPDHLTLQAIKALNATDVFFVFDKGGLKSELTAIRRDICDRHIENNSYRIVTLTDPRRDAEPAGYKAGVDVWHRARAELLASALATQLSDQQNGGFLVWGDPAIYDSTIRLLRLVNESGLLTFDFEVIPGISSVQILAARHRLPLNEIGEPVLITTGRNIKRGIPADDTNVVVMLDDGTGLQSLRQDDENLHIHWGAYLGTSDETLISGPLKDVGGEIREVRESERARKGWIMDTYILRRRTRP